MGIAKESASYTMDLVARPEEKEWSHVRSLVADLYQAAEMDAVAAPSQMSSRRRATSEKALGIRDTSNTWERDLCISYVYYVVRPVFARMMSHSAHQETS